MDWSLVLVSQSIDVAVHSAGRNWWLELAPEDFSRALGVLEQFQRENRWRRAQAPAQGVGGWLHPAVTIWAALVVAVFLVQPAPFKDPASPGVFTVHAFRAGAWWLTLTATLLHADLTHLASNLTFGVLLLGSCMARFGPGTSLSLSTLAGAAGFALVGLVREPASASVGASGVIMGALGLLSAGTVHDWNHLPPRLRRRRLAIDWMRGMMLFTLLGLDPSSDVVAHAGGFLAGTALGLAATPRTPPQATPLREGSLMAAWALALAAAWLAAVYP